MANMTLNQVNQLVAEFKQNKASAYFTQDESLEQQIGDLLQDRDSNAHELVAALVELALQLNIETPDNGFTQFVKDRNRSLAKGDNNKFGPFVQAVFSEKDSNGTWQLHEKHKSLAKHANHVRYLVNKKNAGEITGSIQEYIRNYPKVGEFSGLRAIEAQDRKDNPSEGQKTRIDNAREKGKKVAAKATFNNAFGFDDDAVVKLWGRVRNGALEVVEAKLANANEADSLWYRLGK
ncbi:hypothetical protein [Sphingobium sp. LSP13-1-1.1]|uniref:hypothetical protein n=1 Tax=Sphingobium sp. LSP13-1-1.1 TaxID=3135234 RepID=UPI003417690B